MFKLPSGLKREVRTICRDFRIGINHLLNLCDVSRILEKSLFAIDIPPHLLYPEAMCLAIPAKVVSIDGEIGIADFSGVQREVVLTFVPNVKLGDYVLVHAGFAIQTVDEDDAQETLKLLEELANA